MTRWIRLSGTWLRRASLTSRFSAGFFSGWKQSSPEPSQLTQAFSTALRCFWLILEPVTSAATFCSSLHLPVDELLDVGMVGVDDHHLRRAARGAARLDGARGAVADLEEAHQAGRLAAAGEPLAFAAQPREVGAGAGAVLEQPRLAHPQVHDAALVDEVVIDRLDEAGVRLRMLVGGLRLGQLAGLEVDVEVALARAVDAVGPVQAGVEPLRRVRRAHLRGEHVAVLVEERLGVGLAESK